MDAKLVMLGTKLRNRYSIIQELGVGGFGQTFLAQDCDFPGEPWCVVKQLKPQLKEPWMLQTARRLFNLEALVLARIGNHPQIPQLKAHFEEDEQFYLVQDFIEGELLSQELKEGQIWSQEQALLFLQDTLEVLRFIHENQVIHRDLKPENIIRRKSDQKLILIDFGSVKKITTLCDEEGDDSEFTVAIGTPAYMPVEQQGGKPSYNSDIYALGKILIQGLTGIPAKRLKDDPQTGELLWQHLVNIDYALADIISGMVKWNLRDRYQTVAEVMHDLQPYFQKLSARSRLTPTQPKPTRSTIDKIVRRLKQHPEITRIKKLLFCAYQYRWENNARILSQYRTKFLIQEIWKQEKTLKDFQARMNEVVKTLNKRDKYQVIANSILDEVKLLYDLSKPITEEEPENQASSQLTAIREGEGSQTNSSSSHTNLTPKLNTEGEVQWQPVNQHSIPDSDAVSPEIEEPTSSPAASINTCSVFDLRYEITRYTTPLRIKILLFSMLYYKISFNEQDWSLMMSHPLDSLLKQVVQMFPNLLELESRLYETARHFKQEEGLTPVVGAIIQSLRPFYEQGQPTVTH